MDLHEIIKRTRYFHDVVFKRMLLLHLQILYQCNFACQICDFWQPPYTFKPKLSLDQVEWIAEKIKPLGPQFIAIEGGEPLLHEELFDIIRVLAKDNFPIMASNGWYITPRIAKELFKAGLYEASVSLDYIDPEKHDYQRGKVGAHEHAIQAVKALNDSRQNSNQRVHITSVLMEDNLDDMEDLASLAQSLGVTHILSFYSQVRGSKSSVFNHSAATDKLLNIKNNYQEFVSMSGYLRRFAEFGKVKPSGGKCHAGKNSYCIDSHGSVTRCIDKPNDPVGNIFSDSLKSLMHGLKKQSANNACNNCWTRHRGTMETLLYGSNRIYNTLDYFKRFQSKPLNKESKPGKVKIKTASHARI